MLIDKEGRRSSYKGCEAGENQMRMILKAAIEGLSKTEQGCEAKIFSNNQYLVLGINDSRRREKNCDLWAQLEELLSRRHVQAEYVAKHKCWLRTLSEVK